MHSAQTRLHTKMVATVARLLAGIQAGPQKVSQYQESSLNRIKTLEIS